MTYILLSLVILWVGMTRAHNVASFPTQDALLVAGATIFIYGVVMLVWNKCAGAKRWWV